MADQISMEDIGTPLDHIEHLRENWQTALDGLRRRTSFITKQETELILMLEHAIKLVNHYLTEDFSVIPYATVINNLPKVKGLLKNE